MIRNLIYLATLLYLYSAVCGQADAALLTSSAVAVLATWCMQLTAPASSPYGRMRAMQTTRLKHARTGSAVNLVAAAHAMLLGVCIVSLLAIVWNALALREQGLLAGSPLGLGLGGGLCALCAVLSYAAGAARQHAERKMAAMTNALKDKAAAKHEPIDRP